MSQRVLIDHLKKIMIATLPCLINLKKIIIIQVHWLNYRCLILLILVLIQY